MKPYPSSLLGRLSRRLFLVGMVALGGCAEPLVRSQSPEDIAVIESKVRLVGDMVVPYGTNDIRVEAAVLITKLDGTGGDPPPSALRSAVLDEMQRRRVQRPSRLLRSSNTAVAIARGFIPPGARKGDRFDIELTLDRGSKTTSLRGGWMMKTQLRERAFLGGRTREGALRAIARGPIFTDPTDRRNPNLETLKRGRVLGGGYVTKSRPMGLVLKPSVQHALLSKLIGDTINRRFYSTRGGLQVGMAKAKTDTFIELSVHPRYKMNVPRFIAVLQNMPIRESVGERLNRLRLLERQLLDPLTSYTAALRLEAIGLEAVEVLKKGVKDSNREIRFNAAEALAYLDRSEAVPPLAAAARDEPTLRARALVALGAMDALAAHDALAKLLDGTSVETRYAAFRALHFMNPNDLLVAGSNMRGQFRYHVLETTGPPLIHVTRTNRPELVVFGSGQRFNTPLLLHAGGSILLSAMKPGDQVTISKISAGDRDQTRVVPGRFDDVIRAVVSLGGSYADVVELLHEAKQRGVLTAHLAVDAVPHGSQQADRIARSR
ncbi:MAG: flagellar basal body P-ring protein FlgI [Planctomycetes bacterium]|nr:flagellar basal body P-ring protein FlgI [Planctomycetota bacterium]